MLFRWSVQPNNRQTARPALGSSLNETIVLAPEKLAKFEERLEQRSRATVESFDAEVGQFGGVAKRGDIFAS